MLKVRKDHKCIVGLSTKSSNRCLVTYIISIKYWKLKVDRINNHQSLKKSIKEFDLQVENCSERRCFLGGKCIISDPVKFSNVNESFLLRNIGIK